MGSRRLITVLLVCLVIYNDVRNTHANRQEERREYQYQRSSNVVGGSGYYNSRSGNVQETTGNFDGWTQSQRDQVEGMAEKLRTELSSGQPNYGQRCSTICAVIPGFAGRSQEEIDQIAKEMTSQIIEDLQSGKLARSQINQPNWFENQVAQKILELQKHHQEQYQQNVYRATSRFHENQGTYNRETEDVQQQQENVFNSDDLRQVQQSVFDQRQHQQQGNFYQQQSQNQQHTVYTRPPQGYYNTQTTNRESTNEERFRTVYPTPIVVTNSAKEERNFTSSSSTASVPQVNIYNQYGRTDKETEDAEYIHNQQLPTVIPSYNRSYHEHKEYEERHRNTYRPVTYPTRQTTYETEDEQRTVEVYTPVPVPATNNRHSIYNYVEESDVVPNYRPRVEIDENTQFEILDHRRGYETPIPTTRTQTTIHETEENDYRRQHVPVTPATPQTTYREDRNEEEVHQFVQQVTPRYQPTTSQHMFTEETEETATHFRPRPYPIYPNYGQTIEQNKTSTSTIFRRPTYPLYPSFRTNSTVFENGDTYIRYESHIPRTYVIELTDEEYDERWNCLTDTMSQLGYTRLNEEEYNATIAAGGFTHNGYRYIYNDNTKRFDKTTTVIELSVDEYNERLYLLKNSLRQLGFEMTDEEYNTTIATDGFTRNGYRYVYNDNTRRFEKTTTVIELTVEEYNDRLIHLMNELRLLDHRMTDAEYNKTLATGSFTHGGYKYVYNVYTRRFEKTTTVIDLTVHQYNERRHILSNELRQLGYQMTDAEYNKTIATGSFTHGGYNYVYNGYTKRYEKTTIVIDLTVDEYNERRHILMNELRQLGYQMSDAEFNKTIATDSFTHGGYNYVYNGYTRRYEKTTIVIDLTVDEYIERRHILMNALRQLGYQMTDAEYNKTIATDSFTHGGYNYVYNDHTRRYEKTTIVIDLTVDEYIERRHILMNELRQLGYQMTDAEYNKTIANGSFTHGGYNYVYNGYTRRYEKTTIVIDLTVDEYNERRHILMNVLNRLGYQMTDAQYNTTIVTGSFTFNGITYVYNSKTERYEVDEKSEYQAIYQTLQQKLREIGFGEMCQQEVQQTITTGVFIRDGHRFVYDSEREDYKKILISNEERKQIFTRIQELLRRLGYRLLTQKENAGFLHSGHFIRDAHQWIYNYVNGTVVKTIFVGDFAEFTDDEYREIYQKIQDTLRRIGYAQMSASQCNATITSGTFDRGGIYWSYNPNNGEFEMIRLSQEEYQHRVQILRDELKRLGHREVSTEELRTIIYQGYFYHSGYRYEYIRDWGRYERMELSAEEYRERVRQLQEQLSRIGYGTMNVAECNSTITNGVFYYNGYEWVYTYETRDYRQGNRSGIAPTTPYDRTKYTTVKPKVSPTISKNRGDQPPQHFEEDYEDDEILEEEPGMGYYPIGLKPEIGLSTIEPFDRLRETTELPTTARPQPTYAAPSEYQHNRYGHDQQLTTQMWPTQSATISERRHYRKKTTYTQTTGVQPEPMATSRSMRHVPGSELDEDNELEETSTPESSTPFEPLVVSTQAYLVYGNRGGNERPTPYRPDDQDDYIERYINKDGEYSPTFYNGDNKYYQQQEDRRFENNDRQAELDFIGQPEDDVQQQLIDVDIGAEDLRQQQVDVNSYDPYGQQRPLDGYTQESGRNEYNSHYHGQKESADEYEAQVAQVADKENNETPGLWNKVKAIFG